MERKHDGGQTWHPVVKSTGLVKEKEFAKLLAKGTVLKPKEIEVFMSQISNLITDLLLNGNTVQFANLGSFRTTVKTEASNREDEVNSAKIKKVTVRFTESAELKNTMSEAKFVDVASLAKKQK